MLRGYRFFVGIGGKKEFYIDIELKKKVRSDSRWFFSKSVFLVSQHLVVIFSVCFLSIILKPPTKLF